MNGEQIQEARNIESQPTPTSTGSTSVTEQVQKTIAELRQTFASGKTRPYAWRRKQLEQIIALISNEEEALTAALKADLGKSHFEGWAAELNFATNEAKHTIKKLKSWMKPKRVSTPLAFLPAKSKVYREPLGLVLIIGPWNYPAQLVLGPMIGAIAAGNCAIVKPSEVAPETSATMARLIPKYMDTDAVRVIEGGVEETTALLKEPFDHIFFTGAGNIGKIVMRAAADHLTPVTLELGGKSPCIIDKDVDMTPALRRIVWGKFFNAGQTCVAPDYILVEKSREKEVLEGLQSTIKEFFGDNPRESTDFSRIVNHRHFDRLSTLLADTNVAFGGETDRDEKYISPTLLTNVDKESPVMQEEIFGPILPVLPFSSIDEVTQFINDRPKPLALYLFTKNQGTKDAVLSQTSSGGACINQTMIHLAVPDLPFGGVGASGMGAYHGRASFETFSHRKSVMDKPTGIDLDLNYPPFTEKKIGWIRKLL